MIWQTALRDAWGIETPLEPLDGEYDLNFRAGDHVLKVMREGCDTALVEVQIAALARCAEAAPDLPLPRVVPTRDGAPFARVEGRIAWLQTARPGLTYALFRPHSAVLIEDLGRVLGRLDRALRGFDHPALDRELKWDLSRAGWVADAADVIEDPDRRALIGTICAEYAALEPSLAALPAQAIHNDVNDYNVLVALDGHRPSVSGLIDLGDICRAPRICDLAIAAAYVVLGHPAPERALEALVAGYHGADPLTAAEIDLLWPLLRMRLAKSVVNSTRGALANPRDPYVTISQAPAWAFLEGPGIDAQRLLVRLRVACDLPVSDAAGRAMAGLRGRDLAPVIDADLARAPTGALSVEASAVPRDPFDMTTAEAAAIGSGTFGPEEVWLGHYGEPRLIYTAPAFRNGPRKGSDRRTVHLGVDIFAPAGTAVHTPLPATVEVVENRAGALDYGGMAILRHETPEGDAFWTLHGHLDPESLPVEGDRLAAGQPFARLGAAEVNGGWAPHLHLQLALTLAGMGTDWPGVADPDDLPLWTAICPNPALLLGLPDERTAHRGVSREDVLEARRARFGGNLRLSYARPLMILRGWRHHLFDAMGRPYLDAYNNVPHVGHAHPRIRAATADQLERLNTNTRYLHPAQAAFAEKLLERLPDALSVCWFVNSGSEANELALRLARAATGQRGMITPDHGYHGNTTGAIDISAYKFNAPGGVGPAAHVALVDCPDTYRGVHRGPEAGEAYAAQVDDAIARLAAGGHGVAGFIAETFPSVGGQIIPPPGYLAGVYRRIRAAGGLCIADEVQTGLGRLGTHWMAYETQGVTPDIVVLGKPIGNGHPLGVVITRPEVARAFAEGPEFFATFGGSTLSCVVGRTVLDIVEKEGLAGNAAAMGAHLLDGLRDLQARHEIIGDLRGMGLFLGIDLVTDRESRSPATAQAAYVMNRLAERRVLIGREGPADNILKVRPPLTIDADGVAQFLEALDAVLSETGAQP